MELYQLKTFVVVSREQNITRAALCLNTSQPAVSGHIKALEGELGVELFKRTSRGMLLTEAGGMILEKAERVLAAADELSVCARNHRGTLTGSIEIGINSTPEILKIGDTVNLLGEKHRGLRVNLVSEISGKILEEIRAERLDSGFFFGANPFKEVEAMELAAFTLVIAGNASLGEELADAPWEHVAALPWIGNTQHCPFNRLMNGLFREKGLARNVVVMADQEQTVKNMVRGGTGIAALLSDETRELEKSGDMVVWKRFSHRIALSFAWPKKRSKTPELRAVLGVLADIWGCPPPPFP